MNGFAANDRYETMRYNRCGRTGLKLPAVSLGLWHNFGGVDTYENARAMVRRAFDLANNYGAPPGSAEETFGRILRQDLPPQRASRPAAGDAHLRDIGQASFLHQLEAVALPEG